MRVSVVIPTLNEAGNILDALATIDKELVYPKEIIVFIFTYGAIINFLVKFSKVEDYSKLINR